MGRTVFKRCSTKKNARAAREVTYSADRQDGGFGLYGRFLASIRPTSDATYVAIAESSGKPATQDKQRPGGAASRGKLCYTPLSRVIGYCRHIVCRGPTRNERRGKVQMSCVEDYLGKGHRVCHAARIGILHPRQEGGPIAVHVSVLPHRLAGYASRVLPAP